MDVAAQARPGAQYSVTSAINRTGVLDERYSYSPYGKTTVLKANFTPKVNNQSTIDAEYTYTSADSTPELA